MARRKTDTRGMGLDIGLGFVHWLTGAENLHYGLWDNLDPVAGNLGRAQEAYTEKLFRLLPDRPCRILDIGGGAGETAKKLIALGHEVDIVVPSAVLARRCEVNAPEATTHHMMFEDFHSDVRFDLCLFSESYQYIPLDTGLRKCLDLLAPDGRIILADCFRTPAHKIKKNRSTVGGGHRIEDFRALLEATPVEVLSEEDITEAVAPSVDIEQGLFNVIGKTLRRVDTELAETRPKSRWAIHRAIRFLMSERRRARLDQRLNQTTRTAKVFCDNNQYLMMALRPAK